ncbi:hypothetical protein Leryth_010270 [Lithospermum erythrorhizon]|nr:hypothetical protein Leryth_010270 [Lithospermum erythrorhizon]
MASSCSFLNVTISFLNFIIFILAATSIAPTILLKMPPTSFGWAFIMVSSISIFSSFVGFYSHLTHFCLTTHVFLLLTSSFGQLIAIFGLFFKENSSLSKFKTTIGIREAKLLVRLECGVLMVMFAMQLVMLLLTCASNCCPVKEYDNLEAEKEAIARKRSKKIAKVQEESMANAVKMVEEKGKELDEKMNGQKWIKSELQV